MMLRQATSSLFFVCFFSPRRMIYLNNRGSHADSGHGDDKQKSLNDEEDGQGKGMPHLVIRISFLQRTFDAQRLSRATFSALLTR
jgi:hypothetical protein